MATKKNDKLSRFANELLARGKSYPEAAESHPWGETALGVRKKNFLFLRNEEGTLSFSLKLPRSRHQALVFPFAAPTAYGLGKHGWVTFTFQTLTSKLESECFAWLQESYVAVAPKSLGTTLQSTDSKARG